MDSTEVYIKMQEPKHQIKLTEFEMRSLLYHLSDYRSPNPNIQHDINQIITKMQKSWHGDLYESIKHTLPPLTWMAKPKEEPRG